MTKNQLPSHDLYVISPPGLYIQGSHIKYRSVILPLWQSQNHILSGSHWLEIRNFQVWYLYRWSVKVTDVLCTKGHLLNTEWLDLSRSKFFFLNIKKILLQGQIPSTGIDIVHLGPTPQFSWPTGNRLSSESQIHCKHGRQIYCLKFCILE